MNTITFIMIATIVVYLLGMLAIGFIFSKNNNDSTDFYLGGRKMGPLVTAMSAEASDMSSWLLMGIPGLAYFSGIAEPSWTAIGLGIGTWLNWLRESCAGIPATSTQLPFRSFIPRDSMTRRMF